MGQRQLHVGRARMMDRSLRTLSAGCRRNLDPMYAVFIYSYCLSEGQIMRQVDVSIARGASLGISHWRGMYADQVALIASPGRHHKALLSNAHALHRNGLINAGELSDLLELADGALAYAVESLHGVADE